MVDLYSALLIVDMQNEFVHPAGKLFVAGAPETLPRLAAILEAFRAAGRSIVYVARQHRADGSDVESVRREPFHRLQGFCLPGSWGAQIVPELAPRPGEKVIWKHGWSAFCDTELDPYLRGLGVDALVVGGTQTPNCIRATLYDATALGYQVYLLGDGTSSATPEVQASNLRDLAAIGIPVVECAALLTALAQEERASPPRACLRPVRPEEKDTLTRRALETIRQGDLRLDAVLHVPKIAWWARRVLHDLYHRRSRAFWLEVDGQPVGFLVLHRAGTALRIEALGIFPEARRQGWGRWLLMQAEEEARRLGLARLELEVSSANIAALALYNQAGFLPIPRRWSGLWLERRLVPQEEC